MLNSTDYQGERAPGAESPGTNAVSADRNRLEAVPPPRDDVPTSTEEPQRGAGKRSEVDRLENEVREAEGVVQLQDCPELYQRQSGRERASRAGRARRLRKMAAREQAAGQRATVRRDARARRTDTKLQNAEHREQLRARRAEHKRRRLSSPVGHFARLHMAQRAVYALLLIPAAAAVLAGAVNVQTGLVELFQLGPADVLWWIGYLLEPMLTLPLLAILVTQAATADPINKDNWRADGLIWVKIVLLAIAEVLNVAPHAAPGSEMAALMWSVPPAIIAVTMVLLPKLTDGLANSLLDAKTSAELEAPVGRVEDSESAKLLRRLEFVRELDAAGEIGGERDEHGVPSTTKIREALARRERIGKEEAGKVRDALGALAVK